MSDVQVTWLQWSEEDENYTTRRLSVGGRLGAEAMARGIASDPDPALTGAVRLWIDGESVALYLPDAKTRAARSLSLGQELAREEAAS